MATREEQLAALEKLAERMGLDILKPAVIKQAKVAVRNKLSGKKKELNKGGSVMPMHGKAKMAKKKMRGGGMTKMRGGGMSKKKMMMGGMTKKKKMMRGGGMAKKKK